MKQLLLGKSNLEFFRTFLSEGNYLGGEAARVVDEAGELLTWLPDEIELADVSLKDGWRHEDPPIGLWKPLGQRMRDFLAESPVHVAVVETCVERAANLPDRLRARGFRDDFSYFTCDGGTHRLFNADRTMEYTDVVSVFGFRSGMETTADQISNLISDAFPFHEIYILTSWPDGIPLQSGEKVNRTYLRTLANRAQFIAIGAYDGSGVILWNRAVIPAALPSTL